MGFSIHRSFVFRDSRLLSINFCRVHRMARAEITGNDWKFMGSNRGPDSALEYGPIVARGPPARFACQVSREVRPITDEICAVPRPIVPDAAAGGAFFR